MQVQFGKLVVREKSLTEKAELDKEKLGWYRRARKDRAQALANLDRAGLDIEIAGHRGWSGSDVPEAEREYYGGVSSYVLDKKRNILGFISHKADASPWAVVDAAIANALNALKVESAAVTDEPRYTPVAEMKKGKLVPTGEGIMHRLSTRGRHVETGRINLNA